MMIESITITKVTKDDGTVEYALTGTMPIDEAARALVVIAFNSAPPQANSQEMSSNDG